MMRSTSEKHELERFRASLHSNGYFSVELLYSLPRLRAYFCQFCGIGTKGCTVERSDSISEQAIHTPRESGSVACVSWQPAFNHPMQ